MNGPLIEIGRVTRCHGIRGEVRIESWAESLDLFSGPLWLSDGRHEAVKREVASLRAQQGAVLVRFEGVENRTAAEGVRGLTVLVPTASLPDLDEGEVYLHELEGLTVIDDASGKVIGVLQRVEQNVEQELWLIESLDGKEILFPAVKEFVGHMDLQAGSVRILPPPGLLEIYLD